MNVCKRMDLALTCQWPVTRSVVLLLSLTFAITRLVGAKTWLDPCFVTKLAGTPRECLLESRYSGASFMTLKIIKCRIPSTSDTVHLLSFQTKFTYLYTTNIQAELEGYTLCNGYHSSGRDDLVPSST